jgi:hypothetical protein
MHQLRDMRSCQQNSRHSKHLRGYTYLGLLLVLTGVMYIVALSVQNGAAIQKTEAERQLWLVGTAYEKAILQYAKQPMATRAAQSDSFTATGPLRLEQLLKDPRTPGLQRHLRNLYADPMTGQMAWGIIRDASGSILGIYSMDKSQPIKRTGFDPQHADFENAKSYEDWIFGLPQARQIKPKNSDQPLELRK